MVRHTVVAAWQTDHYPLGGTLSEAVLVLEDGRAVYLSPGELDELCEDFDDAVSRCIGVPEVAPGLLEAWRTGYSA